MNKKIKNKAQEFYDVIIVGGGLSGLQTAVSLAHYGVSACVIERGSIDSIINDKFDGRTCAIAKASSNLMKKTGVWDKVEKIAEPMWDIDIQDGDLVKGASPFSMHYNCDLVGGEALGYIFENNALRKGLYQRLQELDNAKLYDGVENFDYEINETQVDFEFNDNKVSGKLLIACDGKFSKIREQQNIELVKWNYNQTAIVCTVDCEKNHRGTAVELFLPSGPFASLPMNDNKMSIIWSEKTDIVPELMSLNTQDFKNQLKQRFGDWLGDIRVVDDKRFSYPLSLQHAKTYIKPRLALVADSAHSMHPIAGQGFNMGMRDIAALTECLVNAKRQGRDIGDMEVLQQYEQFRYVDNTALVMVCDGLTRLFSNDVGILRLARVAGLGMLDKIRPAKKFFMKHAMGMVGFSIPLLLTDDQDL
ncbi:MAG: UbiH/UbiF/VisC/COQ6 family ubiquinone biosynthesis hydroxylase [Alphaproteobacteria bacterium]